jgi:hypothetical protein
LTIQYENLYDLADSQQGRTVGQKKNTKMEGIPPPGHVHVHAGRLTRGIRDRKGRRTGAEEGAAPRCTSANCFDPNYEWLPMKHFPPLVHEVFGREPTFEQA